MGSDRKHNLKEKYRTIQNHHKYAIKKNPVLAGKWAKQFNKSSLSAPV